MSTFLIMLIPKCPFCFAAYSSAITICGIRQESYNFWELYLLGLMILIIFAGLILRYRGLRTLVGLGVAGLGTTAIFQGVINENLVWYYLGAGLLLAGSMINRKIFRFGNLNHYFNRS